MNTMKKVLIAAGCGLLILGRGAFATPAIGHIDSFGAGSSPDTVSPWHDNWTLGFGDGLSIPGGSDAGTLSIHIDTAGLGGPGFGDVVTSDADFIGSYALLAPNVNIQFQLTSGAGELDGLALYFHTTATGGLDGEDWTYALTPVPGTLHTYVASIGNSNDWFGWDSGDFATAITGIDYIGLRLINANEGSYVYELDNFEIQEGAVPEPETVWMIMVVLLSLGVTFRSRLAEVAGQLKTRFAKV